MSYGCTFYKQAMTEKATGLFIYFAYPYHSWERGTNENINLPLRELFPKQKKFVNITQETIEAAVTLTNNLLRKKHNYLTPYEVFHDRNI